MSSLISIIVPTYDRPAALRRCLESIAAQDYPREAFEVIVVDDGGTPAAAGALTDELTRSMRLRLTRQPNRGVSAARSTGIAQAAGTILAFLDDDCTVPRDYLSAIDELFARYPAPQVIQVRVVNPDPRNLYAVAWDVVLDGALQVNLQPTRDGRALIGTLGGVCVADRRVFDRVAWDERFRRTREDADLRYQLQEQRVPVYYEPSIRVFHHGRGTLWSFLAQFVGYGRGEFHLRQKWQGRPPPYRHARATSRQVLQSLLRTHGLRRGLALYAVIGLRRHAALWGFLYESAVRNAPAGPVRRWASFLRRLAWAYTLAGARASRSVWRRPAGAGLTHG